MSDYFNRPSNYDSQEVIQEARREIDRRVWTREDGHDLATHLKAARQYLTDYLSDLDQRNLVSGTIFNYLRAAMDVELEKVREADDAGEQ